MFVGGAAGAGKSALIHQFLRRVDAHLLRASGDESEAALPYGIVEQLLGSPPADSEPLLVGSEVLDRLEHSYGRPVIAVIDDAQWADRSSLQALTFVLRRLRLDTVLVIVIARDLDDPRVPEGLRRVLHDASASRLILDGLNASEIALLCERLGLPALRRVSAERLRALTNGNPLHTRALLEEIPTSALDNMDLELPAPRSYTLLVLGQLAGCEAPTRQLVEAASVLGMSAPLSAAGALVSLTEPLPALEEAVATGLVRAQHGSDGLHVRFTHPLTRTAVYHNLGPATLMRLHARAAELSSSDFHRLRHRVHATAGPDPTLAAELADHARDHAADGHWQTAADHLLQAAQLIGDLGGRGRLMAEALGVLLLDGRFDEASHVSADLPEESGPAVQAYASGHLAAVVGRTQEAETLLTTAWTDLDPTQTPVIARRTAQQMAMLSLMMGHGRGAERWALRALSLTPQRRHITDFTVFTLLTGLAICGDSTRALALTRTLPDPALASPDELDALLGRGLVRTCIDDLPGALEDLGGVVTARRERSIPFRILATALLGQAEYRAGRWDDALLHTESAASLADDAEQTWIGAICHALAALVPAARGEWERAEAHIRAAQTMITDHSIAARVHTAYAQAQLAVSAGDHHGTAVALRPLLEFDRHDLVHEPGVVPWHDLLVDALIALGDQEDARSMLDRHATLATVRDRHSVLAALGRNRGNLLAADHDLEAANTAFMAGLAHARQIEAPFVTACLQLHHGTFLRRTQHRAAAIEQLRAAGQTLLRLGARPYLEKCDQELVACGQPARHQLIADPHGLTSQEQAVCQLAVRGMANRQIAAELVLSTKTVEYHLSRVYAKVGVTSRTALITKLATTRA